MKDRIATDSGKVWSPGIQSKHFKVVKSL